MHIRPVFAALIVLMASPALAGPPASAPTYGPGRTVEDVSDTRWTGRVVWDAAYDQQFTLHFRPDGVMVYGYDGRTFDNGRWTQNDRLVFFDTNQNFALYAGRLSEDGREWSGQAYSRSGGRATFSFRRD